MFTHFPKDRNCDIFLRTKITTAPCRRRTGEALPRAENFGDLITADHKILNEEQLDGILESTRSFIMESPRRSETNGIAVRAVR